MAVTRSFARYIAVPVVSAGILGGAAMSLVGLASADTDSHRPHSRPGQVATSYPTDSPVIVLQHHDGSPGGQGLVSDVASAESTPTACSSHAPAPVTNRDDTRSMPRSSLR